MALEAKLANIAAVGDQRERATRCVLVVLLLLLVGLSVVATRLSYSHYAAKITWLSWNA